MNTNSRWPSTTAFIFLVIALALYAYSTKHHYDLIYGLSNSKSFCNVSSVVDCDAVNTSSYSEIFGVPLALLGAFTFFIELLLLLGYRTFGDEEKQKMARLFFYLCTFNVAMSFYYGFASFFVLKLVCTICLSIYACSFVLYICAIKMVPSPRYTWSKIKRDFGNIGIWIFLAVIPLGSMLINGMYKQSIGAEIEKIVENSLADWQASQKIDFFTDKSPDTGNPQGKFQMVEFSDFECPHCKRAAPTLHAFVNSHKNDVHFTFQNYPLDNSCNKYMKNPAHQHSCLMAKASLCAQQQGKFWQAHDWIFENQESLSPTSTDDLVNAIGLDKTGFQGCMADGAIATALAEQIERGHLAGLQGTPSVYVNGRLLPSGHLIPVLNAAFATLK